MSEHHYSHRLKKTRVCLTERVLRVRSCIFKVYSSGSEVELVVDSSWIAVLSQQEKDGKRCPSTFRIIEQKSGSSLFIGKLFRALKAVQNFVVEDGREIRKGPVQQSGGIDFP